MQKQNNKYSKNPPIKNCINIWIKIKKNKKGDKSQIKIRLKTQIHEIQKYRFFIWDSGQIVLLIKVN